MKTPIALSANLLQAIHQTVNAIAPDAMEFCDNNDCLIEMALDANRLETFANKEADTELRGLIAQFGYPKVFKTIAKDAQFRYI